MATLNEKRSLSISLHKALHRNVYLLSLSYPLGNDLQANLKEGMFEKPNRTGFHQLSFYLRTIIDPKSVSSSSSWALFDVKLEAQYRGEFVKFVNNISKEHEGYISHIMASWLVNSGGYKVARLMFELSQVALKVHISMRNIQVNFATNQTKCLSETRQIKVVPKLIQWNYYTHSMQRISNIYKREIKVLEDEHKLKHKLLSDKVAEVLNISKTKEISKVEELLNVFKKSELLEEWSMYLDDQLTRAENTWKKVSTNVINMSRKCKERSEEIERRHSKKNAKEFILKLNDGDRFAVPPAFENELSVQQNAVIRSVVKNGVLNFPNLIRAYSIVMMHIFRSYAPPSADRDLEDAICEKLTAMQCVQQQSKDLVMEVFKFHNQLKDKIEFQPAKYRVFEGIPSLMESLSLPPVIQVQSQQLEEEEYLTKLFSSNKCSDFVFHSRIHYQTSTINQSKSNKNIQKKHFTEARKRSSMDSNQSHFSLSQKKPEYMRNIEEVQQNMKIISRDGNNKTQLFDISSASSVSQTGRKNTRPSIYSQNHIQRLFTSTKKRPNVDFERSYSKKWENLFDESIDQMSILVKARSSPNLKINKLVDTSAESSINVRHQPKERISGVKEIDYSSFLSGLGSMPNLTDSALNDKSSSSTIKLPNDTSNRDKVLSGKKSTTDASSVFLEPSSIKKSSRKSVDRIINNFMLFKERSKQDNLSIKKNLKVIKDSFIENVGLEEKKDVEEIKNSERSRLRNVPDLLSPSLDFR